MGVLTIPNEIKIDFHESRYIAVNVKQYDSNSREIILACCNKGKFFKLNKNYHIVFMRLKRPDDKGMMSQCDITTEGKIKIILTNQMLDVVGRCYVDVIVFDKLHSASDPSFSGMFVTQVIDDGEGNIEIVQTPPAIVDDDGEGNVSVDLLQGANGTIAIPENPYPYVVVDDDGNVTMANISETGEISIPDANIATTMTFYINVIPSVFHEGIELI